MEQWSLPAGLQGGIWAREVLRGEVAAVALGLPAAAAGGVTRVARVRFLEPHMVKDDLIDESTRRFQLI